MTAWVREAFPDMKPAPNAAYGFGKHSDAVKQVPRPWRKNSELVGQRSMLGKLRLLARRLLP